MEGAGLDSRQPRPTAAEEFTRPPHGRTTSAATASSRWPTPPTNQPNPTPRYYGGDAVGALGICKVVTPGERLLVKIVAADPSQAYGYKMSMEGESA